MVFRPKKYPGTVPAFCVMAWNALVLSKKVGGLITSTCGFGGPHYGEEQTAELARWYVSRSMGCGWFELIGSLGYSCGV